MCKNILNTTDQIYYVLSNHISKQWIGYVSIKLDLEYVKKLVEKIILPSVKDMDEEIIKSLWITSVIIYGKCFTSSKGRKIILDEKNFFKTNFKLKSLHKDLMTLRHNYIAHAGNSIFENIEPRIRLANRDGILFPHLVYQGYTLKGFDKNVALNFIDLINEILIWLEQKIENVGSLILDEEGKKSHGKMIRLMKKQHEKNLKNNSSFEPETAL